MDDMAAYYPPSPGLHTTQYSYYQRPPPGAAQPPPAAVPQLQHQYHHPHQPPPFTYCAPPLYTPSFQDEVRTLFIAGLPEDVKPREIYNLFREFPGYESCHLRSPSATQTQLVAGKLKIENALLKRLLFNFFMLKAFLKPFGFAVFVDQPSALGALHALNGLVFDLEKGSTLYIDLAKSNSRSKRPRIDDERHGSDKRAKGSAAFSRGISDPGVGSVHMPGLSNSAYNMIGYPSAQRSHGSFDGRAENTDARLRNSSAPACPTIFVANLGPACTEQELTQVFSRCRGFLKLKMQSTYGTPVAFVDFVDTACSTEALNHLQGTVLYSSVSGEGMRLELK
ncbi:Nucleotide-binding, alpha-beta plait [Cynara cardunculus var. scolymus]|uniref:Nucleotide-binding, alpha-beta plait n=1 Tax=Cynara cardunculus var. scolymus TaxID=59895 RepID=A0A103Y534_CYNCS|nr:Nucleotide-binding, alpha-beta plait [Cynara cardunculus var. scolymus]